MSVKTNIGKISAAIESGKRAAASIDYGPITDLAAIGAINNRFIGDWQNPTGDEDVFIFGVHNWADPRVKVTK